MVQMWIVWKAPRGVEIIILMTSIASLVCSGIYLAIQACWYVETCMMKFSNLFTTVHTPPSGFKPRSGVRMGFIEAPRSCLVEYF